MLQLELRDLTKDFGDRRAVRGISLGVQAGEFFSILGPSGCGKTTVLRLVAGYERPDAGKVILAGRDITRLEPHERNVGMVFQNYALFPHMTVGENVAFGLRARRVDPEEVRRRVRETLEFVDLSDRAAMSVPLLSGGEQQRVAVARALVTRPEVMLLDEPLSNLDVSLRLRMREEIRALQRSTGITTLYVTHDQGEALSLSDRVAVMRSGELEQVGTPAEIYDAPRSRFVAEFLGGANCLEGRCTPGDGIYEAGALRLAVPPDRIPGMEAPMVLCIKPEGVVLSAPGAPGTMPGIVVECDFLGFMTHLRVRLHDVTLRVSALSSESIRSLRSGSDVGVSVDWSKCSFLPGAVS